MRPYECQFEEGKQMSIRNQISAALTFAAGTFCAAQIASADHHVKSGTYEFVASFVTDYTVVEQSKQTVIGGPGRGTVTIVKSSGGPWVEGSGATNVFVVHIKKSDVGMDLEASGAQTDSSGDKAFFVAKRTAGDTAVGGGGTGRQQITGGTGKYEGVSGVCEYTVDFLVDNRVTSVGTCEWQRD